MTQGFPMILDDSSISGWAMFSNRMMPEIWISETNNPLLEVRADEIFQIPRLIPLTIAAATLLQSFKDCRASHFYRIHLIFAELLKTLRLWV